MISLTPEALPSPAALIATATGELPYQPAEQAAVLQVIELVGAAESAVAVKLVPLLELPAVSCAVTEPVCVPAELAKV